MKKKEGNYRTTGLKKRQSGRGKGMLIHFRQFVRLSGFQFTLRDGDVFSFMGTDKDQMHD
jgi:2-keto-4-pentenoate hydratase/2-oxohepta-3-ene-1,7-dioic acid hydratase in catechol pathway